MGAPIETLKEKLPGTYYGRLNESILGKFLSQEALWNFGSTSDEKVVICGPQTFEGDVYDALAHLGVDHGSVQILGE